MMNRKTLKRVAAVIAILLVVAMIVPVILTHLKG